MSGAVKCATVAERLEELSQLQDGWFDGVGKAIEQRAIDAVRRWFASEATGLFIYPTEDGGLLCEWGDVSLTFGETVYFHQSLRPKGFVAVEASWEDPMPAVRAAKAALGQVMP